MGLRQLALVLFGLALPSAALAADPTCEAPGYRQMDFLIGSWDLTWQARGSDVVHKGESIAVRNLGGCVIEETFSGDGWSGRSMTTFHKHSKNLRQTWIDSHGSYFDLVGTADESGFGFDLVRLSDKAPYMRVLWREIDAETMVWYLQQSSDAGATWYSLRHVHYQRRP